MRDRLRSVGKVAAFVLLQLLIVAGLLWVLNQLGAGADERAQQSAEIAALQAGLDEANARLAEHGAPPVAVPTVEPDADPGVVPIPGPSGQRGRDGRDGKDGVAGATGATGPAGIGTQGEKGETGATGPKGDPGADSTVPGPPGPPGPAGPACPEGYTPTPLWVQTRDDWTVPLSQQWRQVSICAIPTTEEG